MHPLARSAFILPTFAKQLDPSASPSPLDSRRLAEGGSNRGCHAGQHRNGAPGEQTLPLRLKLPSMGPVKHLHDLQDTMYVLATDGSSLATTSLFDEAMILPDVERPRRGHIKESSKEAVERPS